MSGDIANRLRDPNYAGPFQHLRPYDEIDALFNEAADALEAKDRRIAELEAALAAMEPHIRKIHGCASINDEMGRVVTGQTEAARALFALIAPPSSPAGDANG